MPLTDSGMTSKSAKSHDKSLEWQANDSGSGCCVFYLLFQSFPSWQYNTYLSISIRLLEIKGLALLNWGLLVWMTQIILADHKPAKMTLIHLFANEFYGKFAEDERYWKKTSSCVFHEHLLSTWRSWWQGFSHLRPLSYILGACALQMNERQLQAKWHGMVE